MRLTGSDQCHWKKTEHGLPVELSKENVLREWSNISNANT